MSRGQRLSRVEPSIELVGERRWQTMGLGPDMKPNASKASRTGDWSQEVIVDGKRYRVRVSRGRSVRIPYKPRGQNIGYRWCGEVYSIEPHGKVWDGEVGKSIGVRGILLAAGLVREVQS